MSYWQAQGPPDDWDQNHPFAPWNAVDAEEEPSLCEGCEAEVPEEHAEASRKWTGGVWCDTCLVDNCNSCGDWDEPSIAAAERLGVPHPKEPTE